MIEFLIFLGVSIGVLIIPSFYFYPVGHKQFIMNL